MLYARGDRVWWLRYRRHRVDGVVIWCGSGMAIVRWNDDLTGKVTKATRFSHVSLGRLNRPGQPEGSGDVEAFDAFMTERGVPARV